MSKLEIHFDEKEHKYTVGEKEAVSVTTLLQEVGITKKVAEIPFLVQNPGILEEAKERGNYYDSIAEEAVMEMQYIEKDRDLTELQKRFVKEFEKIGLQIPKAQKRLGMIYDSVAIAGTPDVIEEINHYINKDLRKGIIVDVKATGQIRINDVTWQTNFYAWLNNPLEHQSYAKYVMHYDEKLDKITTIQLDDFPTENMEEAVEAYILGKQYENRFDIVDPLKFDQMITEIEAFKGILKEKEEQLKKERESIMEEMKKRNIKSIETKGYKITYTPEGVRRNFDEDAWFESKGYEKATKEEREKFVKPSTVSHKLTITKKKE